MCSACSIAGIRRLHTEAATITPAAKPVKARCIAAGSVLRMMNTHAAPETVPIKGSKIPCIISVDIENPPLPVSLVSYS